MHTASLASEINYSYPKTLNDTTVRCTQVHSYEDAFVIRNLNDRREEDTQNVSTKRIRKLCSECRTPQHERVQPQTGEEDTGKNNK